MEVTEAPMEWIVPEASWPITMPVVGLTYFPMPPWCQKWTWGVVRKWIVFGGTRLSYIAAAYADIVDADENIMRINEFWYRCVFEFCIFGTVENY